MQTIAALEQEAYLTHIIRGIVEHPDEVGVLRSVDEKGVLLTLSVHAEDMGKVIGLAGATAKAIRLLLRIKGRKDNAAISVRIAEPQRA